MITRERGACAERVAHAALYQASARSAWARRGCPGRRSAAARASPGATGRAGRSRRSARGLARRSIGYHHEQQARRRGQLRADLAQERGQVARVGGGDVSELEHEPCAPSARTIAPSRQRACASASRAARAPPDAPLGVAQHGVERGAAGGQAARERVARRVGRSCRRARTRTSAGEIAVERAEWAASEPRAAGVGVASVKAITCSPPLRAAGSSAVFAADPCEASANAAAVPRAIAASAATSMTARRIAAPIRVRRGRDRQLEPVEAALRRHVGSTRSG